MTEAAMLVITFSLILKKYVGYLGIFYIIY